MPIFAKNIIVGDGNKILPPQIEKVDKKIQEENANHYQEIHDGDLHKLINKNSTYLVDMIDLKK